jgi:hypothetical protein
MDIEGLRTGYARSGTGDKAMRMNLEQTGAEFQTTQWTLIEALREPAHPHNREAQEQLAEQYWPVVYGWFRRGGQDRTKAAENTQAFYAQVIIGRKLFERADPKKGGLRALMLVALQRFSRDLARRVRADPVLKLSVESLEAEERRLAAQCGQTQEDVFEKRWAAMALAQSLDRCERHYQLAGRDDYWQAFANRVLRPLASGNAPPSLQQIAQDHGFRDAGHAGVVIHTVKERCRMFLQQVVAQTVAHADEQEIEQRFIESLLR